MSIKLTWYGHAAMGLEVGKYKLLAPKHVIPVHYNTWGLIAQDPHAWARRVEAETTARPHVIKPGKSFEL